MKRKYVDVKIKILALAQDVVTTSTGTVSDNPNVDDGYDLSGFTDVLVG